MLTVEELIAVSNLPKRDFGSFDMSLCDKYSPSNDSSESYGLSENEKSGVSVIIESFKDLGTGETLYRSITPIQAIIKIAVTNGLGYNHTMLRKEEIRENDLKYLLEEMCNRISSYENLWKSISEKECLSK